MEVIDRVGTCSGCGGPVIVPNGAVNPTPHCERCGAIAKAPRGPSAADIARDMREWERNEWDLPADEQFCR